MRAVDFGRYFRQKLHFDLYLNRLMGEYIRYIETDCKCCSAARFMRHIQQHMHAHTHTYIHTNTQIHTHTKTHTRTYTTTQIRRHTHKYKNTYKNTYTHMSSTDNPLAKQEVHSTHTLTCMHTYIHIQENIRGDSTVVKPEAHTSTHAFTYAHILPHIHADTHIQTHINADTYIQTHIHAHASIKTLINKKFRGRRPWRC